MNFFKLVYEYTDVQYLYFIRLSVNDQRFYRSVGLMFVVSIVLIFSSLLGVRVVWLARCNYGQLEDGTYQS